MTVKGGHAAEFCMMHDILGIIVMQILFYYTGMYDYHIKGLKEKEANGETCGRPGKTIHLPVIGTPLHQVQTELHNDELVGFDADLVARDILRCLVDVQRES